METHTEHRSFKVVALIVLFFTSFGTLIYLTASTAFTEPITNWTATTPYPFDIASRNAVVHDGHIYVFGGLTAPNTPRTATSEVKMAQIKGDGTLGRWSSTTPMKRPLYNHAVAADDTHVYVVGGWDTRFTPGISRQVYRARFLDKGGLGEWEDLRNFPTEVGVTLHALEVIGDRLYVFGGWNGNEPLNEVRYAEIQAASLGEWQTAPNSLPVKVARSASVQHNGYVYLVGGGYSGGNGKPSIQYDEIYYARISASDSLGAWQTARSLPGPLYYHQAVIHDGRLVVLGGRDNDAISNRVISSEIGGNGSLSQWQNEPSMDPAVFRFAAVSVPLYESEFIYTIGGRSESSPYSKSVFHSAPPPKPTPTPTPGISAFLDNSPSDWLAPGEVVTYEISIAGNNVTDFDEVRLSNSVPSETELLPESITTGSSEAYTITESLLGDEIEWYYSAFDKDGEDTLTYRVRRLPSSPPNIPVTFDIVKSGPALATADTPIVYTIAVTNNTNIQLLDITVEDEMPIGATYVSGGDGPPGEDGIVRWTVDGMAAKERREFQFTVTATHTLVNSNYRVRSGDGGNISGYAVVVTQIGDTSPPPNGDGVAIVNRGAIVEWRVGGQTDQNQSNSIRNPMTDFFFPFAPRD